MPRWKFSFSASHAENSWLTVTFAAVRGIKNLSVRRFFASGDVAVKAQHEFRAGAARGEICVQTFDRLMRVDDFDFALGDDFSQTRDDARIERQTTFKTNEFDARIFKIRFQIAAPGRDENQIEAACARVAAHVERENFRAAAI